jgi:rhamnosyltransferase
MSAVPKVAILLAMYKPNDTLIKQLASIERQVGVELTYYIGDDGTLGDRLAYFSNFFPPSYELFHFNRVGPGENFMRLLAKASDEDYYAFADQDDEWLEDKLIRHISILRGLENQPAGTHSNSAVLVENNVSLKESRCNGHKIGKMITENCVQGCTLVINRTARNAIIGSGHLSVKWHDWWIGLILTSIGHLKFVPGTDTLYRIHETNTIGLPNFWKRIHLALSREPGILVAQGKDLMRLFGLQMKEQDSKELTNWINKWDRNFQGRILSALSDSFRRKTFTSEIGRRLLSIFVKP